MRLPALALSLVALAMTPCAVNADCRASLVTGIDVSASISPDEIRMQLGGLSEALHSAAVLSAFQSQGCVNIAVYLWSDGAPVVLLPWTVVASESDAAAATVALMAAAESNSQKPGALTNVGEALQVAEALLGQIPPTGRQIVNVVSNGEQNTGPSAIEVAARLKAAGVTINALLFGPSATIEEWYRQNVTGGRGSFVMRVADAGDFAAPYRAKFILDISMVTE
jgi:hypothetical protein